MELNERLTIKKSPTDLDEAFQLVVLCQELSLLLLQGKDVLCRLLQNGCLQIQQKYKNISSE